MSRQPQILAFAGSLRKKSENKKLLRVAVEGAQEAGAEVTILDLNEYGLPVYNQDIEDSGGLPASAVELKKLFMSHQGLLIASPEYNGSLTAALKNVIDWVSRPEEGEQPLACFAGKVAGIMSVSPGKLGGSRGLMHLRTILQGIKVHVVAYQMSVAESSAAFNSKGELVEPSLDQGTRHLGCQVCTQIEKMATASAG